MDASLFNEYLEKRYYDQMKYYSAAAGRNQKKYKNFQWTLIIFSTLTTILAALPRSERFDIQYIIVVSSALVTILTAALKTFQYQELWVSYRNTIEQLKPQIFYYQFNVGSYGNEGVDKESLFVSEVEAILNKEHDGWPVAKKLKEQPGQLQELEELQSKLDQSMRQRFKTEKETPPVADVQQPEVTPDTQTDPTKGEADVTGQAK